MLLDNETNKAKDQPTIDIEAVREKIKNFDSLSQVDKRILLKAVIKKINIFPDKIDIEWNVK